MLKRSFGEVEKRGEGGKKIRYRARYRNPRNPSERISKTFNTLRQANKWLSDIEQQILLGTWKTPEELKEEEARQKEQAEKDAYTFGEYAEGWLEDKRIKLSHTTVKSYSSYLRTHILPRWGDVPLKQITKKDVEAWVTRKEYIDKPFRKHMYDTFRAIINSALEDELIDKSPCGKHMLKISKDIVIKSSRHKPWALTREQLLHLADEYGRTSPHMKVPVLLAGFLGLRLGELRELRRSDIDFKNGTLKVVRACSDYGTPSNRETIISKPKTAKSIREIPLPENLAEMLKEHIRNYAGDGKNGLVFPSKLDRNKHMGERTIGTGLARAGKRCGLPERVSPHDLRHTAASFIAHSEGCTIEEATALLGHETSKITARYTHADNARLSEALATVTEQLNVDSNNVIMFESKGA